MIRGSSSRPRSGLRRVHTVVDSSIKSKTSANSVAKQDIAWRSSLDDVSTIQVRNHGALGIQVGDVVGLEGRAEWGILDLQVKVTSISHQPDDPEGAQYAVVRTDKVNA